MSRRPPGPLARLIALFPPVAAGVALAGAAGALVLAFLPDGALHVALPSLGPDGGLAFAAGPGRAAVLAAVLAGGAACLLAAPRAGASAALILAASAAIMANNLYTLVFAALIAVVLVRHARSAEPAALTSVPAILLATIAPAGLTTSLVVAGAACLVGAGLGAALTLDLAWLARSCALGFAGMALVAAGLGNPAAMQLALEAGALTAPVIALAAVLIDEATGTRSMDWLGGLARGMPRFSLLLFASLIFASLLPPGPGFAAFHAVFDRALGAGVWTGSLAAVALALGFALNLFAAARAFGLVCLGRPRSLRAAAAEDAPRRALFALVLPILCGIGLALRTEPFALVVPLALGLSVYRFAIRSGPTEAAPFDDGFARPPAWLPFGDPTTQISATGFSASLRSLVPPSFAALLPVKLGARLRR